MANEETKSQNTAADMFNELFLYAPLGLLYEYKDSMPELVKRGKSQVQLTKLFAQMAVNKTKGDAQTSAQSVATEAASFLRDVATRLETIGQKNCCHDTACSAEKPDDVVQEKPEKDNTSEQKETDSFPIKKYDSLSAREVIKKLADLSPEQLTHISRYEKSNKARKTVLSEIDRLTSV